MEFSGLAKEVRECEGIEQFDLGGYNQAKLDKLIKDCFSTPIRNKGCCATFCIGGGKATRQKYDPMLQKYITASLISVGYEEDRGASKETPGKFKHQHDTGKNLIFMHVFPHGEKDPGGSNDADEESEEEDPLARDPDELVQVLSLDDFKMFAAKKARSYTAKHRCLQCLKETVTRNEDIETRMANRDIIAEAEQNLYDNCQDIRDKIKWLQEQLKDHIEKGGEKGIPALTATEKESVLEDLTPLLALMKEKLAATTDAKKQAKIQDMLSKNEAIHKAVVEDMEPSPGLPLSQGDRLKAAYHKQRELEKIESKSAQTIEEMRRLQNELPAVNEEIETLQQMSQEIFETDTELDKRVRALKATLGGSKKKKAPASSVFGTSAASGGGSGWSTAGAKKGGSGSRTTGGAKKSGGGNAFAALSLG